MTGVVVAFGKCFLVCKRFVLSDAASHDVTKECRIGLTSLEAKNTFRWSLGVVSQTLSSSSAKDIDSASEG